VEDNRENEKNYVSCAQCEETCGLSGIPQVATDCTTMEGTQEASTLSVAPEQPTNKIVEIECDWSAEPDVKKAA
jgi:hypothetical protein